MMKKQTNDFNLGFLYNEQNRQIFKHLPLSQLNVTVGSNIPMAWFGFNPNRRYSKQDLITIRECTEPLIKPLNETLADTYPKYTFTTELYVDRQYIHFDTCCESKESRKMTIDEIEKELGYKIEIVSSNRKDLTEE